MSSCLTLTIWNSTLGFWVVTKDYSNVDLDEKVKIAGRFQLFYATGKCWGKKCCKRMQEENLDKNYFLFSYVFMSKLYYGQFYLMDSVTLVVNRVLINHCLTWKKPTSKLYLMGTLFQIIAQHTDLLQQTICATNRYFSFAERTTTVSLCATKLRLRIRRAV